MTTRILSIACAGALLSATIGCQSGSGFKTYQAISYKIVKHGTGKKATISDFAEIQLVAKADTNTLADSWHQIKEGLIIPIKSDSKDRTDWQGLLQFMTAGDSIYAEVPCDSILKSIPMERQGQLPKWLRKGNKVILNISCISIMTEEEKNKKEKEKAAAQLVKDDQGLQEYFTKNNIKPIKTQSGLYYIISKEGSGPAIAAGQKVTMNYTGKLLSGTPFDSNIDSNFHHVAPFSFQVGTHQVIPGWDEGVLLLKKGAKAQLFIPSNLAYGAQSPSPTLPANSDLIFDVEVTDVSAAPAPTNGPQAMPIK